MNAKEQSRWDERSEESIDQMLVDIACKCSSLLSAIQCLNYYKLNNIDPTAAKEYRTNALVYMDELYDVMSRDCQTKKTPTPFHTEHYTLNRTKDGWLADPQGNAHEWFDFPTITFSEDGECHVELDAESIDMSGELDTYKEFLTMLHDELTQLKQHITNDRRGPSTLTGLYLRRAKGDVDLGNPHAGNNFPNPNECFAASRRLRTRTGKRTRP